MLLVKEHPFIPTTKDHGVFWMKRDKQITILVTEGKFGAYWQTKTEFGSWCTLEQFLNKL